MSDLPDAPDIARTMRTGYPGTPRRHVCSICGDVATVYGDTSGELCVPCALDKWDELTDAEKLNLLGFDYKWDELTDAEKLNLLGFDYL